MCGKRRNSSSNSVGANDHYHLGNSDGTVTKKKKGHMWGREKNKET